MEKPTNSLENLFENRDDNYSSDESDIDILSCTIYDYGNVKNFNYGSNKFFKNVICIKKEIPDNIQEQVDLSISDEDDLNENFEEIVCDSDTLSSEKEIDDKSIENSSSCKALAIEQKLDFFETSLHNEVKVKLELESDEKNEVFKCSNYPGDNVLKAVVNDKLTIDTSENQRNLISKYGRSKKSLSSLPKKQYDMIIGMVLFNCKRCEIMWDPKIFTTIDKCSICSYKLTYWCKTCFTEFSFIHNILVHLFKHGNKMEFNDKNCARIRGHIYSYKCWKCSLPYKIKMSRDRHELRCNMLPNFCCKFCSTLITYKKDIKLHLLKYHKYKIDKENLYLVIKEIIKRKYIFEDLENISIIYCPNCEKRKVFVDDKFECNKCKTKFVYKCGHQDCVKYINTSNFAYDNIDALVYHARLLHLELYTCKSCYWTFNTLQELNNHKKDCNTKCISATASKPKVFQNYKCKRCNRMYVKKNGKKQHQIYCKGKKSSIFRCAHCKYRGSSKALMESHLRYNHMHLYTGKLLRCKKCGTLWSSIFMLNDHLGGCTGNSDIEFIKQDIMHKRQQIKGL